VLQTAFKLPVFDSVLVRETATQVAVILNTNNKLRICIATKVAFINQGDCIDFL